MREHQHIKLSDAELKLAYELISKDAIEELAYVYGIGAKKYGANSWLEYPISYEKLYGRVLGHTRQRLEGNIYDSDDSQMHMASVAWAALTICHYDKSKYPTAG